MLWEAPAGLEKELDWFGYVRLGWKLLLAGEKLLTTNKFPTLSCGP
jgi:hypothetical protein